MKRNMAFLLFAALLLAFAGGCNDISERELTESTVSTTATTTPARSTEPPDVPKTVSVTTTTTPEKTEPPETTPAETTTADGLTEEYGTFTLSDEDMEFFSHCVFVGDSICSGLMHYGILEPENVAAQGNIAARNIFDFTFRQDGSDISLLPLLVDRKPDYIVFSMGMNDVNITSTEEFAENYRNLLKTAEGFLPDAKLIVLSVTPVAYDSAFTSNENIDNFNAELKKMLDESEKWTYVDVTPELKNSFNGLKTNYSGGDGIHLAPDAYYAILWQLCEAVLHKEDADNADNAENTDNEGSGLHLQFESGDVTVS